MEVLLVIRKNSLPYRQRSKPTPSFFDLLAHSGEMNKSNLYFAAGFLCALSMFGMSKMFFSSEDGKNQHRRRKKVVCFGDSITQHGFNSEIKGWVTGLANWWTRRVDVINRGYSGYNSKWGKFMVQNAVIVEKPDLLFIFFGANDAIDLRVLQHVPLAEYKQNMESIVTQVQKALPHTKIILITPPPVWEETLASMNRKKLKAVIEDRTNERTFTYVTACKSLGTKV